MLLERLKTETIEKPSTRSSSEIFLPSNTTIKSNSIMSSSIHAAIQPGKLAVLSGAASGIGLAVAKKLAKAGMTVVIGDIDNDGLQPAVKSVADEVPGAKVIALQVDVSKKESVEAFKSKALGVFKDSTLTILMANAGVGGTTSTLSDEGWERILGVNMYGVINMCQAFAPEIAKHSEPSLIVNTGSKQGITTPPGSGPAYNVSKAAVKVYTEQLAHELRQKKESKTDVKLLIPGWVHTGLTGAKSGKPKPDGAWTPEQTADFMFERIQAGSFYILCPDNETAREVDLARMEWNVNDVIQDRPALSRWEENHSSKFNEFMKSKGL